MKDADEVLALRRVDACLAADRAIDLGEQRRRDLHETNAASQDACREAGEIADDATTERHDKIAAFEPELEQPLRQCCEIAETFCRLARLHHDRAGKEAFRLETFFERGEVMARDVLVRHDPALYRAETHLDQCTCIAHQAARDQNVIRAVTKFDADGSRWGGALSGAMRCFRLHRRRRGKSIQNFRDNDVVRFLATFNRHVSLSINRIARLYEFPHCGFGIALAQQRPGVAFHHPAHQNGQVCPKPDRNAVFPHAPARLRMHVGTAARC